MTDVEIFESNDIASRSSYREAVRRRVCRRDHGSSKPGPLDHYRGGAAHRKGCIDLVGARWKIDNSSESLDSIQRILNSSRIDVYSVALGPEVLHRDPDLTKLVLNLDLGRSQALLILPVLPSEAGQCGV